MSDRVDTEAVRAVYASTNISSPQHRRVVHDLCDELDRTREAAQRFIEAWDGNSGPAIVAAVRDLRAVLAESGNTEPHGKPHGNSMREPEPHRKGDLVTMPFGPSGEYDLVVEVTRCPTCGETWKRGSAGQSRMGACPDPWHRTTDTEGEK